MTTDDTSSEVYLDDTEILILNAARNILDKVKVPHSYDGGIAKARCNDAEYAIFQALIAIHIYLGQTMAREQIQGVSAAAPVPDPLVAAVTASDLLP